MGSSERNLKSEVENRVDFQVFSIIFYSRLSTCYRYKLLPAGGRLLAECPDMTTQVVGSCGQNICRSDEKRNSLASSKQIKLQQICHICKLSYLACLPSDISGSNTRCHSFSKLDPMFTKMVICQMFPAIVT